MKILMTGKGTSGSWQIRGVQVGGELGARLAPMATLDDCKAADAIIAVKRIPDPLAYALRKSGKPWVWDMVDAYPSREGSTWNERQATDWLRGELKRLKPSGVIWPNARAQADAQWTGPQCVIYHHHRPGIARNPIRERIGVIGYEGSPKYLEGWAGAISEQCKRLNAVLMVNPDRLADVDVVLALRGTSWNGYPQRRWKSNVKLANAHASGTPFIGMPEDGYQETRTGAEYWATTPQELATALKWLESQSSREEISDRFLQAAIPLELAAEQYREFLCALKS